MIVRDLHTPKLPGGPIGRGAKACLVVWQSALRVGALVVALLAYGAVPNSALMQTEVESQLSELLAETSACDVRSRMRGGASRCDSAVLSARSSRHGRAEQRQAHDRLGERLSLGLILPLRC